MKNKFGMLVIILLVLVSLFAPKVIFTIQDNVRFGGIRTGQYESWDITNLVTDYENSLPQRLTNFAKGLEAQKNYYVADLETGSNKDAYDMIEQAWDQEFLLQLLFSKQLLAAYNIEEWKRYVVYDKDYESGVAFLLEYVKINTPDEVAIELLMDTQTGTIYYVKMTIQVFEEVATVIRMESLLSLYYALGDYYEFAVDEDLEMQLYEKVEQLSINQASVNKDGLQTYIYRIPLQMVYGDASLEGILQLRWEDNHYLITEMGLTDIAALITEFSEDKKEQ